MFQGQNFKEDKKKHFEIQIMNNQHNFVNFIQYKSLKNDISMTNPTG